MKYVKVLSSINHEKINKSKRGNYFIVKINKEDEHYTALTIIRKTVDPTAAGTQSATEEEIKNGIIFN